MKIGIIKEGKIPLDTRVALPPKHCAFIKQNYPNIEIKVQTSATRCFKDEEYIQNNIPVVENVQDCDVLIGVKEVVIDQLIENKKYFFFSHTIKEQPYNHLLLKSVVEKNIQLIDYEVLTQNELRVIAFGKWAGIVGAHNALWTWGKRTGVFDLPRMYQCRDFNDAKASYGALENMYPIKIVLTGGGRVAKGAKELLDLAGIKEVDKEVFIYQTFNEPVYVQLDVEDLYLKENNTEGSFDQMDFYKHPAAYISTFRPYYKTADIFINGIYWDNKAPVFFNLEEMKSPDFNIKVIADITCDIAPIASVPSTIRPSTIEQPVYGFNIEKGEEAPPFDKGFVDVMAVDNLPNELPRDASEDFGDQFIEFVLPQLKEIETSKMIYNASITMNGDLNKPFEYLRNYLEGE